MALSNRQRVQGAQDALLEELPTFVEKSLRQAYGDEWVQRVTARFSGISVDALGKPVWDMQLLVKAMADFWNDAFSEKLKQTDRNNIFELRDWRNKLAHDEPFTYDDTYRALDTMQRVAARIGLPVAAQLQKDRDETMRVKLREQERTVTRNLTPVEGKVPEGLKPWRDVILPHPDVRDGKFQAAEFAADLAQVHRGEAGAEYGEPRAFFGRTFVTAGLRDLLSNALTRLDQGEGDPVVELQTNFGGGKTHSMLALYHLFGEVPSGELPGLEDVHRRAGVTNAPKGVNRAVLVGTAQGLERRMQKDGTVTNTLWGEMAYQLAGAPGYALVAQYDEGRSFPPSDVLVRLLTLASPCLILIDEWVTLLRVIYSNQDRPAGSFEDNISFAQALTEATKSVPRALLVGSLPQSNAETAGEGGAAALASLKETFKRVQSTWLPASPEESFEIVRRRLFTSPDADGYRQIDAVTLAFSKHYQENRQDFPSAAAEPDFARRLKASYPIHPALFDALFTTWSTMERFQRTRGVLRFMALVIHRLWQQGDRSLMILPGNVPLDDARVQAELRDYLGESWEAIMNQEVDGPDSLPARVEAEDTSGRLGQVAAARRVTRSIFMCTAPKGGGAHPGVSTPSIFLNSVQPGEKIGPFSDALRRVSAQAVYLYADSNDYWFGVQPTLNRRAADEAQRFDEADVDREIETRLTAAVRGRGVFAGVHVTDQPGEVPDEPRGPAVRLVVLPPKHPHSKGSHESPAVMRARELVTRKGSGDRLARNNLVLLAPDRARLDELRNRVRQYLAWKKIADGAEESNLTPSNRRQANSRMTEASRGTDAQLAEAYSFLLTPQASSDGTPGVHFEEERLAGEGDLAGRAARKLVGSGQLIETYGALPLKLKLDSVLWNSRDHLSVRQLLEYYAQHLYLERLENEGVLLRAMSDGVAAKEPYFGYADGLQNGRYLNLRFGETVTVQANAEALLVRADVARAQIEADQQRVQQPIPEPPDPRPVPGGGGDLPRVDPRPPVLPPPLKLPTSAFVEGPLASDRMVKRFGEIYSELIQNLLDAQGEVEVELVIRARVPGGLNTSQQRTLLENGRSLGLRVELE
jgi:hypothetical protein